MFCRVLFASVRAVTGLIEDAAYSNTLIIFIDEGDLGLSDARLSLAVALSGRHAAHRGCPIRSRRKMNVRQWEAENEALDASSGARA